MQNITPTPTTSRLSHGLALLVIIFIAVCAGQFASKALEGRGNDDDRDPGQLFTERQLAERHDEDCNVQGIEIRGDLMTYLRTNGTSDGADSLPDATASEEVVARIEEADGNDDLAAILVDIDSPGGDPVAAEEIANALRAAKKPTVAVIRSLGASAAYWAATGADRIFASENSTVGSIGVTMSYLDNVERNKTDGLRYIELSSGKFKDSGSSDRPLSEEERALFMRDIRKVADSFIANVVRNRNLDAEKVRAMADGSTMIGSDALTAGLIDEIGSFPEAKKYLEAQTDETASICW